MCLKSGRDRPDFSKLDEVETAVMRAELKQGQSLGGLWKPWYGNGPCELRVYVAKEFYRGGI